MSETDSSPRPSQLQEMRFHGDVILLAFHPNGQVGVSPRKICENLDIVWRYQYEKFRRDPIWGMQVYHRTGAAAGGDPDTKLYLIPFQRLGGWLYTIHASRLLETSKEKLCIYKKELVAAIEDFLRQRNIPPAPQETSKTRSDVSGNVSGDELPSDAETAPEPDDESESESEDHFRASSEAPGVPGPFEGAGAQGPYVSPFDRIMEYDAQGLAIWRARRVMPVLGYGDWERVQNVIDRAIASCRNAGLNPEDHFRASSELVEIGSGAKRELKDYILTRYGCYLVAMNGDPRKPEIAEAQQYFVVRTHHSEEVERNGVSNHDLMVMLTQNLMALKNGHVDLKQVVNQTQQDVVQTKHEAEEAQKTSLAAQQAARQAQEELQRTRQEMETQAARIAELEKSSPPPGHMTIANFARFKGMPNLELNILKLWGANVSAECGYRGITPIKVPVTGKHWKHVNSYPIEVLEETFEELGPMIK